MSLFHFLFILNFVLLTVSVPNYPILTNNTEARISLLNYNISDPYGQSVEFVYTIEPFSVIKIIISNIPGDVFFILVQAHGFLKNVTLSFDDVSLKNNNSASGTSVGLWKPTSTSSDKMYLNYQPSTNESAMVMIAVQAYGNQSPIPGGCSQENSLATPYLMTKYTDSIVEVNFTAAAPPLPLKSWLGLQNNSICNSTVAPIEYVVYRTYFPEQNFAPDMYFSCLSALMRVWSIKMNAWPVPEKIGFDPMSRILAAYPGTGTGFVVVAKFGPHSVVYVPSITYACNIHDCSALDTTFSKILCAVIFFTGIFSCFAAHKFFKIETFLFGFLWGGLICYIAVFNENDSLLYALIGGIATGLIIYIIWCVVGMPILSVTLACTILGYLLAACFFFGVLDTTDIFSSNGTFWATYISIILLVPVLLISISEKANILATSILGAYAIVVPIDFYLGSNVRYILINSIRRATEQQFQWAIIDPPIQQNDFIVIVAWGLLAVTGAIVQWRLTRSKPPFPPPTNIRRIYRRLLGPKNVPERTPLLE